MVSCSGGIRGRAEHFPRVGPLVGQATSLAGISGGVHEWGGQAVSLNSRIPSEHTLHSPAPYNHHLSISISFLQPPALHHHMETHLQHRSRRCGRGCTSGKSARGGGEMPGRVRLQGLMVGGDDHHAERWEELPSNRNSWSHLRLAMGPCCHLG